jgi:hypothetical protein
MPFFPLRPRVATGPKGRILEEERNWLNESARVNLTGLAATSVRRRVQRVA